MERICKLYWAPLVLILAILALGLRLYGINWDQGLYLHPDERFVVWMTSDLRWPSSIDEYFNTAVSPLNPYNTQHGTFVYGTFPPFMMKAIATLTGTDTYGQMHIVGRSISAIADTGTVLMTACLGRRLLGPAAGLLAGLLVALSPMLIQSAHFATVDSVAVFCVTAVIFGSVQSWRNNSVGWAAFAGLMVGLAGASKPNYLASIVFLGIPTLELIRLRGWQSLSPVSSRNLYPAVTSVGIGSVVAAIAFRIAQPYAFVGPNIWNIGVNPQWTNDLGYWRNVLQNGLIDYKPMVQWADRTPVLFITSNLAFWAMGAAFGLAAIAGLTLMSIQLLRSPVWPSWWWLAFSGWCLVHILVYGTNLAQNQRYLMSLHPMLAVLAAELLVTIVKKWPSSLIPRTLLAAVVLYSVLYGLAFTSLYERPITRIEASEWIYQNLPHGSVLSNEYWDDALPMPLPGYDRSQYTGLTLDLYGQEFENNAKVSELVGQLSQVDYVVLSSNRVIDSVSRQPERYPVANKYYEMLLSGELGFEPVATFTQGPEIAGIRWDDRSAEESLTVYEHPEVRIFKKTASFNPQHVFDELNAAWGTGGYQYIPGDPTPNQMLLSQSALTTNQEHGTWQTQVGDGWISQHPLNAWFVSVQIVGLLAFPLTWRAFAKTPDAGFLVAKGVGLLATSALVLTLASWAGLDYGRSTVLIALALLLGSGLVAVQGNLVAMGADVRSKWRVIVTGELCFALVWVLVALVRSHASIIPDSHLMQLTSVMRSSSLPPMDPFMSGGVLHTQWVSLLPFASLGRVLGLSPAVTFNLTIVSCVAMIAGITFSIVQAHTRSRLALLAAFVVALGSGSEALGSLPANYFGNAVGLFALTSAIPMMVLMYALSADARFNTTQLAIVSLAFGATAFSSQHGMLIAATLVTLGTGIAAWLRKHDDPAWWPTLSRWGAQVIGICLIGTVAWLPAITASTATFRNLSSPESMTFDGLWGAFGPMLLMVLVMALAGCGLVLAESANEGNAGLFVVFVAITLALCMVIAAVLVDAPLMIFGLIGVAAFISLWRWQRDESMLWAIALVVAGCLVWVYSQIRPSHVNLAGTSAGNEVLLVVWIMFGLGLLVATSHLFSNTKERFNQILLVIGCIFLSAATLLPTAMAMADTMTEQTRTSLSAPTTALSPGYADAAVWLTNNAIGLPVILTAPFGEPTESAGMSAVTGMPSLMANVDVERRMRPGWESMVDRRTNDVNTIFSINSSYESVMPLIEQYDVNYIIIGRYERAVYGVQVDDKFQSAVGTGHLKLVYNSGEVSIYQVLRTNP